MSKKDKLSEILAILNNERYYDWDTGSVDTTMMAKRLLALKDEQHAKELELARIEAKIEELKYHSLFYSARKYSDKTDWKHEVELIESMNDNRIAELNRFKDLLNETK